MGEWNSINPTFTTQTMFDLVMCLCLCVCVINVVTLLVVVAVYHSIPPSRPQKTLGESAMLMVNRGNAFFDPIKVSVDNCGPPVRIKGMQIRGDLNEDLDKVPLRDVFLDFCRMCEFELPEMVDDEEWKNDNLAGAVGVHMIRGDGFISLLLVSSRAIADGDLKREWFDAFFAAHEIVVFVGDETHCLPLDGRRGIVTKVD